MQEDSTTTSSLADLFNVLPLGHHKRIDWRLPRLEIVSQGNTSSALGHNKGGKSHVGGGAVL